MDNDFGTPLPREFYQVDALTLARRLLGKVFVHQTPRGVFAAKIAEVEAYRGPEDLAAHTARGHRTKRNEVMWGDGGFLYVYFVYGIHHCVNVVAGHPGEPEAVLIRGLDPVAGVELMVRNAAPSTKHKNLLAGPGRFARAFGLSCQDNGNDLCSGPTYISGTVDLPSKLIRAAPRIGINYAGEHVFLPWRLYVLESGGLSRPPDQRQISWGAARRTNFSATGRIQREK